MPQQTAPSWYQPPIPFPVDPKTGQKVKLHLRRMSFDREVSDLPSEPRQLHEMFVVFTSKRNEAIYMGVLVWNKLKIWERYWEWLKFNSEAEYLAYYGLPDGTTLAGWTIMVSLFDKATFVLLGDEVLSFMMRMIGQYQPDTDMRKRDYQAIFDRYCMAHEAFDKSTFYDLIRRYAAEVYEEPQAKAEGVSREEWTRQQRQQRVGRTKRRIVKPAPVVQAVGPRIVQDFDWRLEQCPYCVSKMEVIKAFQEYTRQLEDFIRDRLGSDLLPERPVLIQDV